MERLTSRIKEFFPYEHPRPGQLELARKVYESVVNSKILLARYPVGFGKTAAVFAGLLAADVPRIIYLAHTKSQFQAPIREVVRLEKTGVKLSLVTLASRFDMCLLPRSLTSGMDFHRFLRFCARKKLSGECPYIKKRYKGELPSLLTLNTLRRIGREAGICPYEIAWEAVRTARIIVASYSYLFDPRLSIILLRKGGINLSESVIVVDEAHNLPRFITDSLSSELHASSIRAALREIQRARFAEDSNIAESLRKLLAYLHKTATENGSEVPVETFLEIAPNSRILARVATSYEGKTGVFSSLWHIVYFLEEVEKMPSDSILIALREDVSLAYKIFFYNIPRVAQRVFDDSRSAILTSATLPPADYYTAILGVKRERLQEISYPFTWGENVTLVIQRGISSRYVERTQELFKFYARLIDSVYKDPESRHVLAVFPSYSFMLNTYPFIESAPRLLEKHDTHLDDILEFLMRHEKCLVMITAWGKFSEGVEFKAMRSNLIDTIVIAGLPVPTPSPVNKKLEERLETFSSDKEWAWRQVYLYPALNKVLQIIGRGLRSENDRVRVYLLDERVIDEKALEYLKDYGLSFSIISSLSKN
ncbi:ATP-dependent DNA helicase [Infirmifilum sp.]|uniref:ATP-dependent DNA helicase n=1 Tax=Infirmifilum sp. TaxID=2856575 RepID=UPI003D0A78A6